jgi:hypothetical protein
MQVLKGGERPVQHRADTEIGQAVGDHQERHQGDAMAIERPAPSSRK